MKKKKKRRSKERMGIGEKGRVMGRRNKCAHGRNSDNKENKDKKVWKTERDKIRKVKGKRERCNQE